MVTQPGERADMHEENADITEENSEMSEENSETSEENSEMSEEDSEMIEEAGKRIREENEEMVQLRQAAQAALMNLDQHITQLEKDATVPLDLVIINECADLHYSILKSDKDSLLQIMSRLRRLLSTLQQDLSPIIALLKNLSRLFTFNDILELMPPADLAASLHVSAKPFHNLVLTLLAKAAEDPGDAAHVAGMKGVVHSLVYLWLVAEEIGTSIDAADVLLALLKIDIAPVMVFFQSVEYRAAAQPTGQGLMWRRFFGDRDVYGLLFSVCSLKDNSDQSIGKREKTIAQSRLLAFLPKLGAMSWPHLKESHHPDIEQAYGLETGEGLLDYACSHLLDVRSDVMMQILLVYFFTDLISAIRVPAIQVTSSEVGHERHYRSNSLLYLEEHGFHAITLSYFLDEKSSGASDALESRLLKEPAARYISAYASIYPNAILVTSPFDPFGEPDIRAILVSLCKQLDLSASEWAHGASPSQALRVLASIPRIALLPQRWLGTGREASPLLKVPTMFTNADALNALAKIFGGPGCPSFILNEEYHEYMDRVPNSNEYIAEAAVARAIFAVYLCSNAQFFEDIVAHAQTVALQEKASAACNVVSAIITADFRLLPSTDSPGLVNGTTNTSTNTLITYYDDSSTPKSILTLPTAAQLLALLHVPPDQSFKTLTHNSDLNGVLCEPGVSRLLPWLLRPHGPGFSISAHYGRNMAGFTLEEKRWNVFMQFYRGLKDIEYSRTHVEDPAEVIHQPIGLPEIEILLFSCQRKVDIDGVGSARMAGEPQVATMAP